MSNGARAALTEQFEARLSEAGRAWWNQAVDRVDAEGVDKAVPVLLPALARRLGRDRLDGPVLADPSIVDNGRQARVDVSAWRLCDVAGLLLLSHAEVSDELIVDLWLHGDFEEREIVFRALSLLPVTAATTQLFGEAQRTNTMTHFEALCCDHNLPARACGSDGFGQDDFNRLVLKAAFVDVPLDRMLEARELANPELSRMLQDLATEREAAGRRIWADTDRMIGPALAGGSLARLLGGIEHGDDDRRLAAAEALATLSRPEFAPLVEDRLSREPRDTVRAALSRVLTHWKSL